MHSEKPQECKSSQDSPHSSIVIRSCCARSCKSLLQSSPGASESAIWRSSWSSRSSIRIGGSHIPFKLDAHALVVWDCHWIKYWLGCDLLLSTSFNSRYIVTLVKFKEIARLKSHNHRHMSTHHHIIQSTYPVPFYSHHIQPTPALRLCMTIHHKMCLLIGQLQKAVTGYPCYKAAVIW